MREALTEQEIDTMTANVRAVFNTEWDFVNNPEHIELAFATFQALLAYVLVEKVYCSCDGTIEDRLRVKKSAIIRVRYNKHYHRASLSFETLVALDRINEGMLLCLNELATYYHNYC